MFAVSVLIHILYWLALATWFGSAVFVVVAAPIVFRTIRDQDPTLPMVLSVNLEGQHSDLLAGSIVSNLLSALTRLAYLCAAVLAVTLLGEWVLVARGNLPWGLPLVRTALFLAALGLVLYDARVVRPKVEEARRTYVDNADEPDVANPAKDRFDHFGREALMVLQFLLFVLLGLVLFSGIGLAQRTSLFIGIN